MEGSESLEAKLALARERARDFFSKMSIKPEDGLIELGGEPQLLVGFRAMAAASRDLYERFGRGATELAFYRLGYEMGSRCCRAISEAYGLEGPLDRLLMGPLLFALMGWVPYVDFLRANLAPDESWYLLWETRTRLAESFLSAYGRAEGPRCFMLAGLGAGWCSESFGLPLVAREVLCVARGDRSCRFLVAHRSRFLDLAREDWVRKPTSEFSATRLRL